MTNSFPFLADLRVIESTHRVSEVLAPPRSGHFVRAYDVDPSQGGAFGIYTVLSGESAYNYAVVDDVTSSVSVYRLPDAR